MINIENLPDHIRPGSRFEIGEFLFTREDILKFANAWDPQLFHTNEEAAKNSLLGGLCASGWHTASVWMKLQRASISQHAARMKDQGLHPPEFGPSPGMKHIRWHRPVFVGDRISYANEIEDIRESSSKPGWFIMTSKAFATNQHGEAVMTFDNAVFLRLNTTQ